MVMASPVSTVEPLPLDDRDQRGRVATRFSGENGCYGPQMARDPPPDSPAEWAARSRYRSVRSPPFPAGHGPAVGLAPPR
jgi:hypothetical protein